jgi:hypothetical protein
MKHNPRDFPLILSRHTLFSLPHTLELLGAWPLFYSAWIKDLVLKVQYYLSIAGSHFER